MAEVIGLVASIGTITAAGFKAAKAISTITSELGTAGAEISGIATDLKAVSLILNELKKRLNKADNLSVEVLDVAYEITALCKTDIEGVERFLVPLTSPFGQSLKLKDKVKWLFEKAKVSSRRASLDSLKLTLGLFLHTLDFIENGDEGSEDVAEHIKEEVRNLVVETQYTKTALLDAERLDTTFRSEYENSLTPSSQIENGEYKPEDSALVSRSSMYDQDQMQLTRRQSQTDSAVFLETMSDDDFIEISEHLRLQKVVRELAVKIVHPTQRQGAQAASSDDSARNWQDDDANRGTYTFLPSRDRLEEELENTKQHLDQSLERISLLEREVARYELEARANEERERRQQEEQRRHDEESRIRSETEQAFHRRMEDMRLEQEEAKREVEKARREAEEAAMDKIKAEQKAEQERQKAYEDAIAAAKETARREFEAEMMEREQAQKRVGWKKYFPMLRDAK
ncbi:hypothetical protein FPOAC2_00286 [Fusarium poae]